jgi:hypothetical protein
MIFVWVGRRRCTATDMDVPTEEVGNIDKWFGHEADLTRGGEFRSVPGSRPQRHQSDTRDRECLRKKVYQVAGRASESVVQDMIEFVNLVLIHSCSSYCLRTKRSSTQPVGSSVIT